MKLLGLTGKAGAGKDTVAQLLIQMQYFDTDYAFARPLKNMMTVAGFPEPMNRALKETVIEGFGFTWRDAAQKLGTEWGRGLDKDIWLKIGLAKFKEYETLGLSAVVTDVRFDNEAEAIRKLGGKIWHIVGRQADLGGFANHASEQGVLFMPMIDDILENHGDMETLKRNIRGLMKYE